MSVQFGSTPTKDEYTAYTATHHQNAIHTFWLQCGSAYLLSSTSQKFEIESDYLLFIIKLFQKFYFYSFENYGLKLKIDTL